MTTEGPSALPWTAGPDGASAEAALLDGLTPEQREAVNQTDGAVLVLAAAGSGKTRVITRRVAMLLARGVRPWQILAVTFTNKAAGEMRERIGALLGSDAASRGLTVTTFHALCARLLRRYAEPAGLRPDFAIFDADDQAALCKKVVESLQLSTSNFPPRSVLGAISRAKNELLDAEAFAARAGDFSQRTVAKIYASYARAMREAGAVDFDDLLMLTARVLQRDAGVRGEVQGRWRYLLIDEYQDTNRAQFVIASMIAGEREPNICVVGDPDQSIYGWRGADISNILDFEEHYPGCRTITLGENFRSTAPILAAADALIRTNKRRKHKPLFTRRAGGEPPEAVLCRDERHEASLVMDWLRTRREAGVAWRDMAVFYRTNSLSRVVEDALRGAGVPYTIARGTAYYEREEVRSLLAYLRVIANPADSISLARIINTPARGIGKTTLDAIEAFAQHAGLTVPEACTRAREVASLSPRAVGAVERFMAMLGGWRDAGGAPATGEGGSAPLASLVDRVLRESGLREHYVLQAKTSGREGDAERVDNLDELVSSAREFELEYDALADVGGDPGSAALDASGGAARAAVGALPLLRAFLESVALVADADAVDPAQGSVTLMTLHAAKGLEFDSVAMIGLEQGVLPHSRAVSNPMAGDAELEEERRLCFVGLTRAMRRLHLTAAKYRTIRGVPERTVPSQFLGEVPASALRVSDQSDAFDRDEAWDAGDAGVPPGAPRRPSGDASPRGEAPFSPGARVRHPQFGLGVVTAVQPGASARVTVRFADAGVKTLVLAYARLSPA